MRVASTSVGVVDGVHCNSLCLEGCSGPGPKGKNILTRLCEGLVIAIEPMINQGSFEVRELSDGWTVKTVDGSLSAHYENTVALTPDGVVNLTEVEIGE